MVSVPNPRLRVSIRAEGPSKITTRRVVFDERVMELPAVGEARRGITDDLQVDLVPGRRVRLAVEAANESGTKRLEAIDLVFNPPPPEPGKRPLVPPPVTRPRLVLLSLGNSQSLRPDLLPPIPFADTDAPLLADFLTKHLISPDGNKVRLEAPDDRTVLTAQDASARKVNDVLDHLERKLEDKKLEKGDIVAIVIASHVLEFDKNALIAASDTDPDRSKSTPEPMIPAQAVSDLLGRLTDYGCRVVLFLDGVHELPETGFKSNIKPWVRQLQRERRVITFVASKEGPSGKDERNARRWFAEGILNAIGGAGAAGARQDRSAPYTLEQFRRALHEEVQNLSARAQEADAFVPPEVEPRTLFALP
jgi:hypothetical protein